MYPPEDHAAAGALTTTSPPSCKRELTNLPHDRPLAFRLVFRPYCTYKAPTNSTIIDMRAYLRLP
eukprot:364746-Chlamydomonas_euryale.AAC.1